MSANPSIGDLANCPACGTQWGPGLLACPGCSRLVHSESLKRLSELAAHATAQGDLSTALQHWRAALELLPPSSRQHAIIAGRIEQLSQQVASTQPATATVGTAPATHDASRSRPSWVNGAIGDPRSTIWRDKGTLDVIASSSLMLLMN